MNRILRTVIALAFCFTCAAHALADDNIVKFNKNGQLVPPGNMNADKNREKPRKIGKTKANATSQAKPQKKRTLKKRKPAKSNADANKKGPSTKKSAKKRTVRKPKTAATKNLEAKSAPKALSSGTSVTLKRLPMMPAPGEKPPKKLTKSSPRMLNKKPTNEKALNKVRKDLKTQRDFAKNAPKRMLPQPKAMTASKQNPKLNSKAAQKPKTNLKSRTQVARKSPVAKPGKSGAPKSGNAGAKSTPKLAGKTVKSSGKKLTAATKNPGTPKTKGWSKKAKAGGVLTGIAAGGVGIAAITNIAKTNSEHNNGNITKTQLAKSHATNATESAAALYKLKKLNPSNLLLNDVIGTDPLSLGVEAVGDMLNGTNNAKQSVEGMKHAWNDSLVKESFTDPKSAAVRVGNDVKNTAESVGNMAQGLGNKVDQGFDTVKAKSTDIADAAKAKVNDIKNAASATANDIKNTATAKVNNVKAGVKTASAKVKGFVGGLFKKK